MGRLSFEIDDKDHKNLKMCCVRLGVNIKDFALEAVLKQVMDQREAWKFEKSKNQSSSDNLKDLKVTMQELENLAKEMD